MKASIFALVVNRPFIRPAKAPMPTDANTAKKIMTTIESIDSIRAFINRIMQPEMNAAMEPTERSMPFAAITNVMPMPMMAIPEFWRRMLMRFWVLPILLSLEGPGIRLRDGYGVLNG